MLHDPLARALMPKVGYVRDPELETHYPREWPAWARVTLKDGRQLSAHVRYPKGDPENPLSWEELVEKYRALAGAVWDRKTLDTVHDRVQRLEEVQSLQDFTVLL
jgi:2-methylcitrate dehydratase PrpD